jgi:AI-2 transport protein TqsA
MTDSKAHAALVVLAVLALAAAITWLGPVLRPFLLAVFLYYAAQFGAGMLGRIGLGRRSAYLGLLLCTVIAAVLVSQLVYRESTAFLRNWPKYETRITRLIDGLPQLTLLVPRAAPEPAGDEAPPEPGQTGSTDASTNRFLIDFFREASKETLDYVFRHSLDFAEVFTLVLVYLVFLFMGSGRLPGRIRRAFPGDRSERLLRIGAGITDSMQRFMAVKTLVGLGMAASAGLLMFAFGLDHWLLWAFLFFAANYITYIGSIAACIPPILLAFVDLPSIWSAILLAGLLVANRLVWIDFVEVRSSGRQLNLDPTLMFLWLAYWGWVWGVLGLLLAYPMLAAVKILLSHVKGAEGWAVLLSDE